MLVKFADMAIGDRFLSYGYTKIPTHDGAAWEKINNDYNLNCAEITDGQVGAFHSTAVATHEYWVVSTAEECIP